MLVNWNGVKETLACLASLVKLKKANLDVSIIVVDNGSTDDSVEILLKEYPQNILLESKINLGFTGGNNLGIKYALEHEADFVWLLNNDTTVDAEALLALVNSSKPEKAGIVGSKIYFARGREFHKTRYKSADLGKVIWYAGGVIDWANMYGEHRGVDEVDVGQYDEVGETEFVTGCSMLVKREVFGGVGLLDDKFFAYFEDLDFSLRACRAGFKLLFAPDSRIWHSNASSSGGSGSRLHEYYMTRNRLLVGFRHAPVRTKFALFKEAAKILFGDNELRKQAVRDFLIGKFGKRYEQK